MKRPMLNFLVDATAFVAFVFLMTTGLLLRYQLPPGSGGGPGRGTGPAAAERSISFLWGWTRHEWGQIHYWIAAVLIAVLALHLVLHWKWIVCTVRGARSEASGLRFGLGAASLAGLMLVAAAPLLVPVEQVTRGELLGDDSIHELRGSMTLAEAAAKLDLSVAELATRLDLPAGISAEERLGRALRRSGGNMGDARRRLGTDDHVATEEAEP